MALREQSFLILVGLADEPRHGYSLIKQIEAATAGRVVLRPGTLYGALDRLEADQLVEIDREEHVDGRLRRYYRLTTAGATMLEDETRRLESLAREARRRIGAAKLRPRPT